MKELIKKILSKLGFGSNRYVRYCFNRDMKLFADNSGLSSQPKEVLAGKIRVVSHTIEKALSLTDCRPDFGRAKVENLIDLLQQYKALGGRDIDAIRMAESIIYVYTRHRLSHGLDVSFIPEALREAPADFVATGAMPLPSTRDDFAAFPAIARARHSVRNYSPEPVAPDDIKQAVAIAQTAPSACNRQATKVYAITDPDKIAAIKQHHGGIRSFGRPAVIFAIAQDLNLYLNEYERNTWLVDGGIFCLNFLYALDSVGIVNCPVIWGGMDDEDKLIAELAGIPGNERVVTLVVGGYPPADGVRTPCSPKRPIDDVLKFVS